MLNEQQFYSFEQIQTSKTGGDASAYGVRVSITGYVGR